MMNGIILGCIADDLTGATDLANNLVRAGMRVLLTVDVPSHDGTIDADAVVVALKSRTIPRAEAAQQSLQSCRWLRRQGARQIYFKVCSTFDSTAQGNIGPVIEALMDELNCDFSVVAPAFPDNDRTVFKGHLFAGDVLLSDSGMQNHPLTPMTDANLVRFLQTQLTPNNGRKVGLIDYRTVAQSASAIGQRIDKLRSEAVSIAVADAVNNEDLRRLAAALHSAPLVTASSGLGIGLPAQWGFTPSPKSSELPRAGGRKAIISGSCSIATNAQVLDFIHRGGASCALDPVQLASSYDAQIEKTLSWVDYCWSVNSALPLLVYSTAEPAAIQSTHAALGVTRSGGIIEHAFSDVARRLVTRGVGQLVVAGGETAGVCVRALHVQQMQIGPQIDRGVPWCYATSTGNNTSGLHIALKSGNFGSRDFFIKAFALLE
ncbi:MAG: 3-oxo-tetronate kinase [Terriglobales bacterium]